MGGRGGAAGSTRGGAAGSTRGGAAGSTFGSLATGLVMTTGEEILSLDGLGLAGGGGGAEEPKRSSSAWSDPGTESSNSLRKSESTEA